MRFTRLLARQITNKKQDLETKLLDRLGQSFRVEMPKADTLDGYLDKILPIVKNWGEDLREEKFYVGRAWLEKRDDDKFHFAVLHFYNPEGEYIKSVDGDLSIGKWRSVPGNKFMIINSLDEGDLEMEGELFDLAFMDAQFFILRKHGDQGRLGNRKYFMMVSEGLGKYEWRDLMEMLFRKSQSNISFYILIGIAILFVLAILVVLR